MKTTQSVKVLQAISMLCNGKNLDGVLRAQITYVRETLALQTSDAIKWMCEHPLAEEFFPGDFKTCTAAFAEIQQS